MHLPSYTAHCWYTVTCSTCQPSTAHPLFQCDPLFVLDCCCTTNSTKHSFSSSSPVASSRGMLQSVKSYSVPLHLHIFNHYSMPEYAVCFWSSGCTSCTSWSILVPQCFFTHWFSHLVQHQNSRDWLFLNSGYFCTTWRGETFWWMCTWNLHLSLDFVCYYCDWGSNVHLHACALIIIHLKVNGCKAYFYMLCTCTLYIVRVCICGACLMHIYACR